MVKELTTTEYLQFIIVGVFPVTTEQVGGVNKQSNRTLWVCSLQQPPVRLLPVNIVQIQLPACIPSHIYNYRCEYHHTDTVTSVYTVTQIQIPACIPSPRYRYWRVYHHTDSVTGVNTITQIQLPACIPSHKYSYRRVYRHADTENRRKYHHTNTVTGV